MPNTTLQQTVSPWCLTRCTTEHRGQLNTHYHQTTYPSSPQLTYDMTTNPTDFHQLQEIWLDTIHWRHGIRFCSDHITHQHTYCQQDFSNIMLMADKHTIPKGKMYSNCRLLPDHLVCQITQRDNIKRANTYEPALKLSNKVITSDIQKHKQNLWKGASRRTLWPQAQHTHSLEDHTRSIK